MPTAKSIENLKLHGTFRKDRHGARVASVSALGRPPAWLNKFGREWWRDSATQLVANGVGGGDRSIVESAATWYGIWRATLATIEAGDSEYRTFCKLSMAWKSFSQAAARLGIGPVDRAKIRTGGAPHGKLEKFTRHG